MSRVTDCYGPIPYSAIGTSSDLAVPYDSQETVYDSFFKELEKPSRRSTRMSECR